MADDEETDESFVHIDSPHSVVSEPSGHSNVSNEIDPDQPSIEQTRTMSTIGSEPVPDPTPEPMPSPTGDPPPRIEKRPSMIRPTLENGIDPADFTKYKGLIKKRLSAQQRMDFKLLVDRNIHSGFEDHHIDRPLEHNKKLLRLDRRLSFRPKPDAIQGDPEAAEDLKKADARYYEMYQYREPTEKEKRIEDFYDGDDILPERTRTSSDPNPKNKPVPTISKPANEDGSGSPQFAYNSIENPLDWKFGQRSSAKELQLRGIIPEHYADVVHGDKSLEDAKAEWEEYKASIGPKIINKIDFKSRPKREELLNQNIIPRTKHEKRREKQVLQRKLNQRMDPQEADQRAIISKEELFSNRDYDEFEKDKKIKNEKLRNKMDTSISQRSDKTEIVYRGIVPPEYLEDEYNVARKKIKDQRAEARHEVGNALAHRKKRSYGDLSRLTTSKLDGDIDISDEEAYEYTTFLDRIEQEKENTKSNLKQGLSRRSSVRQLQERGILHTDLLPNDTMGMESQQSVDITELPLLANHAATGSHESDQSDSDGGFNTFLDRMAEQKQSTQQNIKELHKRRPSIKELKDGKILPEDAYKHVPEDVQAMGPQVYMSESYVTLLTSDTPNTTMQQTDNTGDGTPPELDSSSSDDDEDQVPTFLDRLNAEKRLARKHLENHHRRRPTMEQLEAKGVVEQGYFTGDMQVALTQKRERRKSFTSELAVFFTQRPDLAQMMAKGLVAAKFIGNDEKEMNKKRRAIKSTLKQKLNKKRRPSVQELEQRGIVPSGYFNDATSAVKKKHRRRKTAERELRQFLGHRVEPLDVMRMGVMPKSHFQNILGATVPTMIAVTDSGPIIEEIHDDDDDDGHHTQDGAAASSGQQVFNAHGTMSVAQVMAQRMVKQMNSNDDPQVDEPRSAELGPVEPSKRGRRNSTRPSAITNIVLELPQPTERNLLDHDNWTQDLYESLLSSLRFGQVVRRIKTEKQHQNMNALTGILEKYQQFERIHHTKMNDLKRDKKTILEQIEECDRKEKEAMEVLGHLIDEHSSLEQKIRPQMKMLLHKMHLVEQRILELEKGTDGDNTKMTLEQRQLKAEYEKELNYYETYVTELKNVFIHTNNIRSQYQNTIRTVMEHRTALDITLDKKMLEIRYTKQELTKKLAEFHRAIDAVTNQDSGSSFTPRPADPLAFDPIKDLNKVLAAKNQNIDDSLDLLSFRIATIPATDYALRVIELCQLSYVYSNEQLESFFGWFIRFAVQSFIEINYAHTCFNTHNRQAIDEEIPTLQSIQFIADLTTVDQDNKVHFQKALHDQLTVVISYLELLPANDDQEESVPSPYGGISARNNIDHEYVIFHVARYLTADANFSESLVNHEHNSIPTVAQEKVKEWIKVILMSTQSEFKFSKDFNSIENEPIKNVICYNKLRKPRNIIRAMRQDSMAQVRPARAAAIVMDHVYGVLVEG